MEMDDHHYNIDLRRFLAGNRPSHFPPPPPPPPSPFHPPSVDLFSRNHHQIHLPHHYDMMMLMPRATTASAGGGGGLHEFHSDSTSPVAAAAGVSPLLLPPGSSAGCSSAPTPLDAAAAASAAAADGGSFGGGDSGTGRWPRQETLTLLEIRSRLDSKFKEANQKGTLWDEVSRIMMEEHGYQRSGKKCREKFENLYKYYKKTKEGKAGRQDGKHYRFFRQLEALYGETNNITNNPCLIPDSQFGGGTSSVSVRFHGSLMSNCVQNSHENVNFNPHNKVCDNSLSLSNSSEFDTGSSETNGGENGDENENHSAGNGSHDHDHDSSERRRRRRSWKSKVKDFIDSQMRKLIEKQENWLEKLTKTLEQKEQERVLREEEWRNQEAARVEKEHKFWAKERAWIETRDAALMDTLRKLTGESPLPPHPHPHPHPHHEQLQMGRIGGENSDELSEETMNETETTRLVQLRSSLEPKFQQCRSIEEEENLWKEIARKLGYEKNPLMCKEKWDMITNYSRNTKEIIISAKKRKENSSNSPFYQSNYNPIEDQEPATTSNQSNPVNESCFPFLISDGGGENLWENYGLKLK